MREKIVEAISNGRFAVMIPKTSADIAEDVLTLITEEIERVENPYIKEERIYNHSRDDLKLGWYQCFDDILSLFRPKENPVGNAEL